MSRTPSATDGVRVGGRSGAPRSPIPTEAELREWYVRLQADPAVVALRQEIGVPTVRVVIPTKQRKDGRAILPHASIDGGKTILCGRRLDEIQIDPVDYPVVGCQRCRIRMEDEGYSYEQPASRSG